MTSKQSPSTMSDDTSPQPDSKRYRPPRLPPFAIVDANLYANRKVRKAGRDGREVFIFALTRNAARGRTGLVDAAELEPDTLADMLQIDEQSAARGLERAIAANLLAREGDQYRIVGWDEVWARARSESEARQLRREKARSGDQENEREEKEKEKEKEKCPDKARTLSGQCPDNPPRKRGGALSDVPADALRLARLLAELIATTNAGTKLARGTEDPEQKAREWAPDLDKLHRLDGHPWEDIEATLRWAKDHDFWSGNILSGPKFRKQYDQLVAQRNRRGPTSNATTTIATADHSAPLPSWARGGQRKGPTQIALEELARLEREEAMDGRDGGAS